MTLRMRIVCPDSPIESLGGNVKLLMNVTRRDESCINHYLRSWVLELGQEEVMFEGKICVDECKTCGSTVH